MADGYKVGQTNAIKTKAERRVESIKAVTKAIFKGAYDVGMQIAERVIPMGASELANALIPTSAVVQNQYDEPAKQDAVQANEPAKQEVGTQTQEAPQRQAASFKHDYTPSQDLPTRSQGLEGYTSGKYEQPIYTPASQGEIVSSYMSGNYVGNGDPVKAEMNAINAEMREDYAARAQINAMRVEPIQPPEWEGMSR